MLPYQRFLAWQVSHEMVQSIYRITALWPKNEMYGLTQQARRSAYSVPMNIAEGSAKRGSREFRRYLDISLGSLSELSYCLLLARDLGYMTESDWRTADELRNRAGQLTWRMIAALNRTNSKLP